MIDIEKRRLVFSFYLDENSFDNEINKLHFRLLSKYIKRFDEVIFCIIVDEWNKNNSEIIKRLEKIILDSYYGNITFKIYPNTEFRESYVFKNEICDRMEKLDGLTFFGHNKGISDNADIDSVKEWVCGLYYFNFEAPGIKLGTGAPYYGAFKTVDFCKVNMEHTNQKFSFTNRYDWMYCGTFYWGRYQLIDENLRNLEIEKPNLVTRWFSELFPGNTAPSFCSFTYDNVQMIVDCLPLDDVDGWIRRYYKYFPETYDEFIKYFNENKDD